MLEIFSKSAMKKTSHQGGGEDENDCNRSFLREIPPQYAGSPAHRGGAPGQAGESD
jgi:hypothetical protein